MELNYFKKKIKIFTFLIFSVNKNWGSNLYQILVSIITFFGLILSGPNIYNRQYIGEYPTIMDNFA